jgi:hypothetical protein
MAKIKTRGNIWKKYSSRAITKSSFNKPPQDYVILNPHVGKDYGTVPIPPRNETVTRATPALAEAMAMEFKRGYSQSIVAKLFGCGEGTLSRWLRMGDEGHPPFDVFSAIIRRAQAECQGELVQRLYVATASKKADPKVGQWLLSKLNPDEFGEAPRRSLADIIAELSDDQLAEQLKEVVLSLPNDHRIKRALYAELQEAYSLEVQAEEEEEHEDNQHMLSDGDTDEEGADDEGADDDGLEVL